MSYAEEIFHSVKYSTLRKMVIDKYGKHWELLDPAHRLDHFDSVFKTALRIKHNQNLKVFVAEIFLVSYFHDLFTWSRINHHALAKSFIETTDCQIVLKLTSHAPEARRRVSNACYQHRASYDGKFTHLLSKLMSAADRGIPKDLDSILERSKTYQMHHFGVDSDTAMLMASKHIIEKYGRDGYARIPDFHLKAFSYEYDKLWKDIDDLKEKMSPFLNGEELCREVV